MLNKIIFGVVVLLSVFGCQKDKKEELNGKFLINGSVPSLQNGKVLVTTPSLNEDVKVDTLIITNGKFLYEGVLENGSEIKVFSFVDSLDLPATQLPFMGFIDNTEMELIVDLDSMGNSKIVGSESFELYKELMDTVLDIRITNFENNSFSEKYRKLISDESLTETEREKLDNELKGIFLEVDSLTQIYVKGFTSKHPESNVSAYALVNQGINDPQFVKEEYKNLSENVKNSYFGKVLKDFHVPHPFTLPNQKGDSISLESFKGKTVLIDFWAEWCKPCRVENPKLKKLYEKYKDQGFEIISISYDNLLSKDKWIEAIEQDGLTWTQLIDHNGEITGFPYNVEQLPHQVLVDKEGYIIIKTSQLTSSEKVKEEIEKIFN